MAKFLSETGLQTVWSKIDSLFVRKASVSSSNNIASFGSAVTVGSVGGVDLKFTMPSNPVSSNTVTTSDTLTADKIVLGNGSKTVKTSGKGITTTAPSSSSDDTTIPTSKAVWSAFGSVASALKYKGTIASSGGTVTALPASHAVGDVYVVKTAGTYAGKACEVGDYIICNTAGTSANNAHWDVLNGENQVENKSASLAAAGSSATIATVDGTDITVTTPSGWTGLTKTGTITKVGNTTSGEVAVSVTSGGATIGTSATTIATIGGVAVQAKIGSYASSGHDHNTTYLKLDGSNVMTGNLLFNMGDTDKFVVFSYQNTGAATSNSWRMGALGSGTGDANYYVVQYQTVNASGTDAGTWNTAFKIGQSNGVVNFTSNPTIGSNANIHAGNYNSSTYADTTPTQNSTKLITSGGMYAVLDEIESTIAASEDALDTRITTLENNTITGSGLTADKIVLGNGTRTVKTSSKGITTTAPSSSSDDTTIPTSKAVNSAIVSHAGVDKVGTVTSVTLTQGTGITVSSSGTAITGSGSRTISLASVSGLTTGTYRSVTVDTYGRVTAGTNPTTLSGYGITDAKIASGVITLGSNTITPLTSHQTIKQDGITGATINRYGTCSTGASTTAKTVSVTGGTPTLETGLKVTVYFSAKNTANSPTLNVNSLGAKRIYHNGALIGSGTNKGMLYGAVDLVYDSTLNSSNGAWQLVGNYVDSNTHNSHALTVTNGDASSASGTITYVESVTGCSATTGDLTATTTRKSISVLSSHQTIKQDGITGATVNRYGTCSTAAGTAAKTVSVGAGTPTLETGLKVTVYFSAKNTANSPTLNVNSLGAKSIYHNGAVIGSGTNKGMLYGAVDFVYNSTLNSNAGGWQLIGNYVDTTGTNVTDATVQGWGYTKGIKFKIPGGGAYNSTTQVLTPVTITAGRYLKDTSWTDITFSPSSGTNTINAVPIYRQDATWGDWVFYWEGVDDQHVSNGSKGGLLWKNGEFIMAGNFHCTNSLAFYQSGTYVPGSINTGTIGASFYANNNGGGDANSSAFFINVSSAAGGWNGHETFRFDKDGIYAYPVNGRTGITGWFINESDALTNSEIDTILANAT